MAEEATLMLGKKQFRNLLLQITSRAATAALTITVVFALTAALSQSGQAQTWREQVLHSFGNGSDGALPSGMIFDSAGDLYGTTSLGGTNGIGTVFELIPNGHGGRIEQVLFSFHGPDGVEPSGCLIFDAAGNLYGTTQSGSDSSLGTVFELTPAAGGGWTEQVLHNFNGDGYIPLAGLVMDAAGNLYGTTEGGDQNHPYGMVFELTPVAGGGWTAQVIHDFNRDDGADPWFGSLILDGAGNLYGTTLQGGAYNVGVVFELMPTGNGNWTEAVLHSFNLDGTDGYSPISSVTLDVAGNLYGATNAGGSNGAGTVYKLTPTGDGSWTETVLHNFGIGTDGALPSSGLTFDTAGNLYGTTFVGGAPGYGTVFELLPDGSGGWTEQILYSFRNSPDGTYPDTPLVLDSAGNIYGATHLGGTYGYGTAFELTHASPCAKCSRTDPR
jgi:uncharacterized repeat protein (TIGR03803 family)